MGVELAKLSGYPSKLSLPASLSQIPPLLSHRYSNLFTLLYAIPWLSAPSLVTHPQST
jgi:hypothetical protein